MAQTNSMLNDVTKDLKDKAKELKDKPIREGSITKAIEHQTAKVPSIGFLGLALGSMAISMGLELFSGRRRDPANFVGLWVPTFLLLGIYNKLVKLEGSDRFERSSGSEMSQQGSQTYAH